MMILFLAAACILFCCAGTTKDKDDKHMLFVCFLACLLEVFLLAL